VTAPRPDLTVVIASFNARATIGACLESLRRQQTARIVETLLVDSSTDGTAGFVRDAYPEVTVIAAARRLYAGAARNLAMPRARAPIVAFLDADCRVNADWVDRVCEAHARPDLLVGGAVDNAPTRSLVSWAYYFCEFNLWLPSRRARYANEVPGCSLSMKREAFDRYGPFLEGTYSSDTAFQWKANSRGRRAWFTPEARVFHESPSNLGEFLRHTVEHRRGYARVRCLEQRLSAAGRLRGMALQPIAPLLLMGATAWRLRRCPRHVPRFVAAAPLVLLGYAARSWGEFSGYMRGRV